MDISLQQPKKPLLLLFPLYLNTGPAVNILNLLSLVGPVLITDGPNTGEHVWVTADEIVERSTWVTTFWANGRRRLKVEISLLLFFLKKKPFFIIVYPLHQVFDYLSSAHVWLSVWFLGQYFNILYYEHLAGFGVWHLPLQSYLMVNVVTNIDGNHVQINGEKIRDLHGKR